MNKNADNDFRHQLWLIYSQLKDAESDPHKRLELLEHSREELGKVLNDMNKQTNFLLISVNHELKSTSSKAANSNCRNRQFNLTPDRQAYYCLFGLLAVSGMRISEALDLKVGDVDLNAGVLTVKGKFQKSRLIPLHASTLKVLSSYMSVRNKYFGEQAADHVFISRRGTRLMGTQVRLVFHRLCRHAGLPRQDSESHPRIHDLRHTFAVKTLLHWYHSGVDVEARMPVLSTFLGHVNTKDTYWYLSTCPELMGEAVKRLENFWEVKP